MGSRPRRRLQWILSIAILAAVVALHSVWLPWIGGFLVRAEQPWQADIIVSLAGDHYGRRILKACELVRAGYAPRVLVSGPECCYANVESDLAIAFAVRNGCPADWFISFPIEALSTRDEARDLLAELRRRGARRFIIVTSNYHTRRAGRIWARIADRSSFRVVAAPDKYFRPGDWWHSREARKTVFIEWSKTFATWAGL